MIFLSALSLLYSWILSSTDQSSQTILSPTSDRQLLSPNTTRYIEQVRTRWGVQGLTVAVVASPDWGDTGTEELGAETSGYGVANPEGEAVTAETMFAIASNSKLFTALAVGLLIHNHTYLSNGAELDWSTKIKDVLPEWRLMDEYASDHADVLDLMSMRSGMPRHDEAHGRASPSEVIANMRHLRPSYELRQTWQYNNQHYIALSHIIPTLTGQPFPSYVKEHIFDPLGMDATYNATEAKERGTRAHSFFRRGVNATLCAERWDDRGSGDGNGSGSGRERRGALDQSCVGESKSVEWWADTDGIAEAGAGGLVMSANDMAKWLRELLSPRVIPKELIDKAVTPLMVMKPNPSGDSEESVSAYGLAQWTYTYRGFTVHGHTGNLPGQNSVMLRVPEKGVGVMMAVNDVWYGTSLLEALGKVVLDDLLGLPRIDWEDRVMSKHIWGGGSPSYPDLPVDPRPPPPSSSVEGTYAAPGYGTITLLPVAKSKSYKESPQSSFLQTLSHSAGSAAIRLADKLNLTGPIYYAKVDKLFTSHLVFTHFDGPLFNWTAANVLPIYDPQGERNGKEREYISSSEVSTGTAVFVPSTGLANRTQGDDDDVASGIGIGMFGNYWGKSQVFDDLPRVGETDVKDIAEVWYAKL